MSRIEHNDVEAGLLRLESGPMCRRLLRSLFPPCAGRCGIRRWTQFGAVHNDQEPSERSLNLRESFVLLVWQSLPKQSKIRIAIGLDRFLNLLLQLLQSRQKFTVAAGILLACVDLLS